MGWGTITWRIRGKVALEPPGQVPSEDMKAGKTERCLVTLVTKCTITVYEKWSQQSVPALKKHDLYGQVQNEVLFCSSGQKTLPECHPRRNIFFIHCTICLQSIVLWREGTMLAREGSVPFLPVPVLESWAQCSPSVPGHHRQQYHLCPCSASHWLSHFWPVNFESQFPLFQMGLTITLHKVIVKVQ